MNKNHEIYSKIFTSISIFIVILFAIIVLAETIPPTWQNQGINDSNNVVIQLQYINISAQGKDETSLDWAWLSTNESGNWENKTTYNSPMSMIKDNNWQWSNFTWHNSSVSQNTIVGWKIYYNDTSGNEIETNIQTFIIGKSFIEVNLNQPSVISIVNVIQNNTFIVNATVVCREGSCDYVNGTIMYNLTSENPDVAMNITNGDKPFFINESYAYAMKSCPSNPLDENKICNLTWVVNASGESNTNWKIGVLFNSSIENIQSNNTDNVTVSILGCSIDFSIWD
jgi:hypothetical protein